MNSLSFKHFFVSLALLFTVAPLFAASPEFGKATYYNDKYHGKKTASGELYDRDKYTCAHRKLKFGTIVRVTRIDNQLSVEARVNDRGPYSEGFVIDLSYVAAEQIGLVKSGSANVKVEVVEPDVTPSPATLKEIPAKPSGVSSGTTGQVEFVKPIPASTQSNGVTMKPELVKGATSTAGKKGVSSSDVAVKPLPEVEKATVEPAVYRTTLKKVADKGFAVQLSSLTSGDVALSEAAKLDPSWSDRTLIKTAVDSKTGGVQYKLMLGPFETKSDAEIQRKAAVKKGHKKCFIVNLEQ